MWYSFYRKQNLVPSQSKGFVSCLRLVHWSWCNCPICACLFCDLNCHILVPEKINWEDHIRKNSVEWGWQMAVCKLFDERPVWPRQSLYERFLDDNVHVSQNQFKRFIYAFHSLLFVNPLLCISTVTLFAWSVFMSFCLLRLLFRAGYYFSTGPFGKFWIRRGYDPRKDSESQMWAQ